MIEILFHFKPSPKELYLLNTPFEILRKQKQETHDDRLFLHTLSSYHDPNDNEPHWLTYKHLDTDLDIVIAGDNISLSVEQMLSFIVQHNGFSLSRDNLFMLWELYREQLKQYAEKKIKNSYRIAAMVHPDLLPKHHNGPKICSSLEIKYSESDGFKGAHYDWSWIDDDRMPITRFAFFIKRLL